MYDVTNEEEDQSDYECLECGALVTTDTNPVECPECGDTSMQNRALSLE